MVKPNIVDMPAIIDLSIRAETIPIINEKENTYNDNAINTRSKTKPFLDGIVGRSLSLKTG